MKIIHVKWTGIRPLLMHSGLLADPINPYTRAMKKITSKGSKKLTDADYAERDRLEWEGSLYWTDGVGLVIPSDNIERTIQGGAQKSRKGKDIAAAVFCSEIEIPVIHRMHGKSKMALYADPGYTLRKGVRVQQSRIIRVRPMIPTGWVLEFDLEFDDSVIDESSIKTAMEDAGSLVGLGDWRPKFGRFTSEIIK